MDGFRQESPIFGHCAFESLATVSTFCPHLTGPAPIARLPHASVGIRRSPQHQFPCHHWSALGSEVPFDQVINAIFGKLNDCSLKRFVARSRFFTGFLSRNLSISMSHMAAATSFKEQRFRSSLCG